VIKLLSQAAIAPADLIFEVTETVVIDNIGGALAFLSRLRLHGFGLSIDDYGTGYSSVKQLSQIPFTELKMDRSLIDGIASKSHLQVIFESTLSMCNKLGIALVAEGIEKAKDWDYLRLAGCHVAQGYYISPAMPSHEIVNWVRAGMPALHNKMA
jgi:EAL domain-containing protein (putative c-di-GMP-specific phosphodiesterase class I)